MEPDVRKVWMSPDLMAQWATRDIPRSVGSPRWGEPDDYGFYTPAITRHSDDQLAATLDAERETVRRLRKALQSIASDLDDADRPLVWRDRARNVASRALAETETS